MLVPKDVGALIRSLWQKMQPLPGGRLLFSTMIGRIAPYSGTVGARVEELSEGYARVVLHEHRSVRNHLRSVHAMALANLAELSSGLGLMYNLPKGTRGILLGFKVSYLKKARGTLTAEAKFTPPATNLKQDFSVTVSIKNEQQELVAEAEALWRLGPVAAEGDSK